MKWPVKQKLKVVVIIQQFVRHHNMLMDITSSGSSDGGRCGPFLAFRHVFNYLEHDNWT